MNLLSNWSTQWQQFTTEKFKIIYTRKKNSEYKYVLKRKLITGAESENHFGVEIRNDLNVQNQCAKVYAKARRYNE